MALPLHSSTCPLVDADTLRAHWQTNAGLVILDTDFNGGQTVLSAWGALRDLATAARPLHLIVLTPRLPTHHDIAHDALAEQLPLADMLFAALPPDINGYHRLILDGGKVMVTLILGDAVQALTTLRARVDVLYIKPAIQVTLTVHHAKRLGQLANPHAQLWADGTTPQRNALWQAGGFVLDETNASVDVMRAHYLPRWAVTPREAVEPASRQALVIGAGLAGTAIAERLTVRGWDVTVFETADTPAQGASGNLAGIYMPMVSQDDNPASRLNRAGYFFAQQLWAQLGGIGHTLIGEACGVLQVARDDAQQTAFMQAAHKWQYPRSFAQYLDNAQASQQLGLATRGGWLFPQAGWLRPSSVCQALLAAGHTHAGQLTVRCATKVARLRRSGVLWEVLDDEGCVLATAPTVILANGMAAATFDVVGEIALTALRGQVSHVASAALPTLPYVLSGEGYMTRAYAGVVSVGATYGADTGQGVSQSDHVDNIDKLRQLLPGLTILPAPETLTGRVGLRCVTPDRMPLVGALPMALSDMPQGAADKGLSAIPRIPGLYGLLGYASRGLIMAPLAAEMLACQLSGEPMPVCRDLQDAVDPARFVLRQIRQSDGGHQRP